MNSCEQALRKKHEQVTLETLTSKIEVVGTPKDNFAKAADDPTEAAKTVRGLKWVRVAGLEIQLGREERSSIPMHNKDLLRH